jgi:plastocyanin
MKQRLSTLQYFALTLLGSCLLACGKDEPKSSGGSSTKPAAPGPTVVDSPAESGGTPSEPGTPGSIRGTTVFVGDPPARQEIALGSADGCSGHDSPPLTERIIVQDGKLANVFVYVSKGLSGWKGEPVSKEPVIIHQSGCIYHPHLTGMRAGRTVHVENRDSITHNVHGKSLKNGEPNQAQAAGSRAIQLRFDEPEVPVTLACDLHPWMKAFVCVVEHPFFAVTGADGSFSIPGLPAGKYTLTAWHEAYGRQKVDLEVTAGGAKQVQFSYPK